VAEIEIYFNNYQPPPSHKQTTIKSSIAYTSSVTTIKSSAIEEMDTNCFDRCKSKYYTFTATVD